MYIRKNKKQIVVLKRKGRTVGYETWQVVDGLMRQRISETLDGPGVGMILHDQRCQYRTPATKTTGELTADKYFTRAEVDALFAEAGKRINSNRGMTTNFILAIMLGSGMRASELCGLLVKNTPMILGVDQLKVRGKGGKIRPIPIRHDLSEYIIWYIKNIRRHYVRRPMRRRDWSQPLLLRENGKSYDRYLLWRRIHNLGLRAGLDKSAGTHRCRHSYGTHLYRDGVDVVALQRILGHASVSTTQIYARSDPSKTQEMLKKVHILNVRSPFLD